MVRMKRLPVASGMMALISSLKRVLSLGFVAFDQDGAREDTRDPRNTDHPAHRAGGGLVPIWPIFGVAETAPSRCRRSNAFLTPCSGLRACRQSRILTDGPLTTASTSHRKQCRRALSRALPTLFRRVATPFDIREFDGRSRRSVGACRACGEDPQRRRAVRPGLLVAYFEDNAT